VKIEPFEPLDAVLYREVVRRALAEDLGWGDLTTEATIEGDALARGTILAKSPCVIAGLDIAEEAFRQLDPLVRVERARRDGDWCEQGVTVAVIEGRAAPLLTAERTALNFLQRLSGIATVTRRFVEAAADRIVILDTRKTVPTLRLLDKYAVRAGGGRNHRMALDDGVLIKDNHIRVAGGVRAALERARARVSDVPIQIEAQSIQDVVEALEAGATRILADNLPDDVLAEVVSLTRGRAQVEVSGGVTLARIPAIAASGADFVSIGGLTHSVVAADLSLEIEPLPAPSPGR
jgi:nicotinate-nucleotide pyrophosphorylase (carboxylating)